MSVTEHTPVTTATGNGSTTTFAFDFLVLAEGDIVLTVAGVAKTVNIDFTVSGLGDEDGGTVTFTTAPASGAAIVMSRETALDRTTDYQTSGDFRAATVNDDFDRLWLVMNEIVNGSRGTTPVYGSAAALEADLADQTDDELGAGKVGFARSLAYPDRTVGQRIHRDYVNVGDMGGTDPTGTVDNTAKVLAALATGKLVRLDGFYRVNGGAISLAGYPGIVGDGSLQSGLRIAAAGHAITIPSNAGYGRKAARLEGFAIDSVGNVCDGHYAIYAGGVASGAVPVYNSGLNIAGLDIGVTGRMGGGFYIKDVFRLNVQDVGLNSVSWMIRIIGSVVQAKFRNVTSNNDAPGSSLSAYGISTESASYSSGTLVPENVHFIDCSYILGARGINHAAGRDVWFVNFDGEVSAIGAMLNAPAVMHGGIILPSPAAAAFTGVYRGVAVSDADEGTDIIGVEIQMSRVPGTPSSSYGFDIGDGASPVYGLVLQRCRVRGENNALAHAIRGRQLFDATISDNFIRSSVMTGTEIDISGGRRFFVDRNRVPSGAISINDGGEATAYGTVIGNQCSSLTTTVTTVDNWTIAHNEPASTSTATRLVGESKGTFTATLTGCTTSPTGTARYVIQGRQVTIYLPAISGTSNSTAATLTGMPASLYPNRQQDTWGAVIDNGATQLGAVRISTGGVITLYVGASMANFTGSGTKGVASTVVTYSLE